MKFIADKGIGIAQSGQNFTISNTMKIKDSSSVTATQDANGDWSLTAVAPDITFYKDADGATVAGDKDEAKSVKVGDNLYKIGNTYNISGSGASVVEGAGAVNVQANTGDPVKYTVSVPVINNTDGGNATVAKIGSDTQNSLAVGSGASIENKVQDSIAIGAGATVGNGGKGNIVIGNGASSPQEL
ncbi:MAG: hypothetical protein J6W29_01315 [Neisseriaceae bacterium]|nr:hypothetical protein [Neisseriaceae bacterium]